MVDDVPSPALYADEEALIVTPAKAGVHLVRSVIFIYLDSRFRGNDNVTFLDSSPRSGSRQVFRGNDKYRNGLGKESTDYTDFTDYRNESIKTETHFC